ALLLFLPVPWNVAGFMVAVLLGIGEATLWHRTVRGQRAAVGADTLIGREAIVVTPCRPEGQVRIDAEIWSAQCPAGADEGERVQVVGRRRLQLVVAPAGGAGAPGGGQPSRDGEQASPRG